MYVTPPQAVPERFETYTLMCSPRCGAQVAARHVTDPAARTALTQEAGRQLAARVAGHALQTAASARPPGAHAHSKHEFIGHKPCTS